MNPRVRVGLGLVAVAAVTTVLIFVLRGGAASDGIVASGTVEITEANLGFQRPGRIERVEVEEGDIVADGQVIAMLDQSELLAERTVMESQRAAAIARLSELEAGSRSEDVAQAREALRAATERAANARREADRAARLFAGGAISERQRDAAATTVEVADADRDGAVERLALVEAGPRMEQIAAQRAVVAQATAGLTRLDATLEQTVIRAPFAGRVTVRYREPGETVAAGTPVVSVANSDDRWVRIYIPGDEVGRVGLDQAARITADAFADRSYTGIVTYIADEAEFTPRTVQTTAERVKLVYRVKVRITGDTAFDLKPGLPADVQLLAPRS
ncbi:MAG: HlyD family efflux transporter periplasmic adaptor subunit [Gemmatimonadota bacterium]|nr:HlyD family efflux transporter periplasmic adaptor subunit [Gemmatimonadota bacterium]MDH4350297.1 HlyD family efflux transporter periplasmic adaptor subunit [Gemmatimonadota bacterium]MDH5198542.1 HlyD family efflux transporter periplasmic adaptor subunit [Gemmatimonadota bacterium]